MLDKMCVEDWEEVREIYLEGIATGHATFQKEAPSWADWDRSHTSECRFVARLNDQAVGWAALSPVSSRPVYAGVAEVSIYISQKVAGKGVGSKLLNFLVKESEQHGFWTLQASIFPENSSSLKIHLKNGFREVGRRGAYWPDGWSVARYSFVGKKKQCGWNELKMVIFRLGT